MKQFTSKQRALAGALIVLLIGIGVFLLFRNVRSQDETSDETVFEEPTEVIPTVDPSVQVRIEGSKEATLNITGIPAGTTDIEYELSYNTSTGSIEGLFGTIEVDGESTVEEEITFGTCSSGVCRYHEITGEVHGVLKFSGDYGDRLLEKDFTLEK